MAADPRDILTIAEAKRTLRIGAGDTKDDDVLEIYITAASRLMDQHFGDTVARSVTDELHDGVNSSGRGFRTKIILGHRPLSTITQVVEHRNGVPLTLLPETTTQLPQDAFLADRYPPDRSLFSGIVRRRISGFDSGWEPERSNITVTYTAGRVASTTQVDARFKRACGIVLENLWRDREPGIEQQGEFDVPSQSFPGFAVPNVVRQMLSEEWGQHQPWGIA